MPLSHETDIEKLKDAARKCNANGSHLALDAIIARLEEIWTDDRAAKAFYTELEANVPKHTP